MIRGREWTGFEAVALQEAMRKSVRDFAAMLGIDTTTIANWRSGLSTVTPRTRMQEILDTTLAQRATPEDKDRFDQIVAEGETVWRRRHQRPDASKVPRLESPQRPNAAAYPPAAVASTVEAGIGCGEDRVQEVDEVNRREFGGTLLGLTALAATSSDAQAHVAPELVDYFRSQLAGHYSADRFLGPTQLIPAAVPQYELLCELANAASGNLRSDFWSLATGYAAFLGWLYQDAGDLRRSTYWHDQMLERAHRSQDPQLVGFALHNKAMLEADKRDGRSVLDLTGAALQQRTHLIPKVEVLLLQQAAHGTSLIGGDNAADECGRLLDEAAVSLEAVDDEYPWGACRSPRYIDVQQATIWTRLGLAREAIALWEQIIPDIPASQSRDRGVFTTRHAQALAAAGEPEQALATVAAIPPLVVRTGSARMRTELFALQKRMQPWSRDSAGRALDELLSSFT
ncbi:hypothetical protein [Nocardia aurea]|uniref:hypothetical protein n=1 Tax=Nocardia aurea TaxID=2144174 RepID=UPI0033A96D9F